MIQSDKILFMYQQNLLLIDTVLQHAIGRLHRVDD